VDDAGELRAAMRDSERPLTQLDYLGFRCVRSLGL
jgi:formylglycine-generating enzyme required for sulfatase activity